MDWTEVVHGAWCMVYAVPSATCRIRDRPFSHSAPGSSRQRFWTSQLSRRRMSPGMGNGNRDTSLPEEGRACPDARSPPCATERGSRRSYSRRFSSRKKNPPILSGLPHRNSRSPSFPRARRRLFLALPDPCGRLASGRQSTPAALSHHTGRATWALVSKPAWHPRPEPSSIFLRRFLQSFCTSKKPRVPLLGHRHILVLDHRGSLSPPGVLKRNAFHTPRPPPAVVSRFLVLGLQLPPRSGLFSRRRADTWPFRVRPPVGSWFSTVSSRRYLVVPIDLEACGGIDADGSPSPQPEDDLGVIGA